MIRVDGCARNAGSQFSNGVTPQGIAAITGETPVQRKRSRGTVGLPVLRARRRARRWHQFSNGVMPEGIAASTGETPVPRKGSRIMDGTGEPPVPWGKGIADVAALGTRVRGVA